MLYDLTRNWKVREYHEKEFILVERNKTIERIGIDGDSLVCIKMTYDCFRKKLK